MGHFSLGKTVGMWIHTERHHFAVEFAFVWSFGDLCQNVRFESMAVCLYITWRSTRRCQWRKGGIDGDVTHTHMSSIGAKYVPQQQDLNVPVLHKCAQ